MSEARMNKYRVWVVGFRDKTTEELEAISSFEAREAKAAKHDVDITDVCSVRLFEDGDRNLTERNVK